MNKKKKVKNMLAQAQAALMICAGILLPVSFPCPAELATHLLQIAALLMVLAAALNVSTELM